MAVIQVGSKDIVEVITGGLGAKLAFTEPQSAAALLTGDDDIVTTGEGIVILPPLDGDVTPTEVAQYILENGEMPVIVVGSPANVNIDAVTGEGIEFIPTNTIHQCSEIAMTRLAFSLNQREYAEIDAAWRTDIAGISNLFDAVTHSQLNLQGTFSLALTMLMGQLGYPGGYITKSVGDTVDVISTQGIDPDGFSPITDEISHRVIDIGEATSTSSGASSTFHDEFTRQACVATPIECGDEIFGTICLVDDEKRDADQVDSHLPFVDAVANLLGTRVETDQIEKESQRQIDRLENFMQIVSHDMITPLGIVKARLEILDNELENSSHTQEGLDAIDRLEEIIDSSVEYAKSGETVDNVSTVKIHELVENCWQRLEVDTTNADFVVIDRFSVVGDNSRIQHIFMNLFRNSIKHGRDSAEEAIRIRVGLNNVMYTTTRGTPTGNISFYVEDNGHGIPHGKRETVFETGESDDPSGTGFGLPIIKEIAEAHGWEIQLTESHEGGARFEFHGAEAASN
jgi:signal transduction histidine kinase